MANIWWVLLLLSILLCQVGHFLRCCYFWEQVWNKLLSLLSIFYVRKNFFSIWSQRFQTSCLFQFEHLSCHLPYSRGCPPPSILHIFESTCIAQMQSNAFALLLSKFLGKYKLWLCFTVVGCWSLHLSLAENSHLTLLGILDVASQNSLQSNVYLMDPCHTEVLIYKIHKELICIFPNLSFCLWRLCSSESRSDCFCCLWIVIRMVFVSPAFMSISAVVVFTWLLLPYQFEQSSVGCLCYCSVSGYPVFCALLCRVYGEKTNVK